MILLKIWFINWSDKSLRLCMIKTLHPLILVLTQINSGLNHQSNHKPQLSFNNSIGLLKWMIMIIMTSKTFLMLFSTMTKINLLQLVNSMTMLMSFYTISKMRLLQLVNSMKPLLKSNTKTVIIKKNTKKKETIKNGLVTIKRMPKTKWKKDMILTLTIWRNNKLCNKLMLLFSVYLSLLVLGLLLFISFTKVSLFLQLKK